MSRSYLSLLTKLTAIYIPNKSTADTSSKRTRSSMKQPAIVTVSEPAKHRCDLDFIATLWVDEEFKNESSSDESELEEDSMSTQTTNKMGDKEEHRPSPPFPSLQRWFTAREYVDNVAARE